jgi:D-amino-acid dehydrogenase
MAVSSPTSAAKRSDERTAGSTTTVAVVGAGIVGACIAHVLRKRGVEVALIDRDEPGRGCSYGNSGAISESSIAPVAMPGVLASVPGMLVDSESPLYLPLGYLPRAAPWLAQFVASARPAKVAVTADKLARLHARAVEKHLALAQEVGTPELCLQRGHLHLYPDEQAFSKDAGGWRMRERFGFKFERLDRDGIVALEPGVHSRYQIGIFLADHATILNPFRYVSAIVRAFVANGGVVQRREIQSIQAMGGGGWQLRSDAGDQSFDHVVVAAGAWSRRLLDPIGVRLALESQRGYHVQFQGGPQVISRTVVLADRKIFVTPMEDGVRVGGTVEIGGLDRPPDSRRAAVLERIARDTFEGLRGLPSRQWMGHRPCMPDSVPVVGPVAGRPGLWTAVGHGHLGVTDSINTAEQIADGLAARR